MDIKEAKNLLKAKFEIKLPSASRLWKLSILGAQGHPQLDKLQVVDILSDYVILIMDVIQIEILTWVSPP
jgi:hypothetical protein